jgi:hypothetical protein
VVAKGDTKQMMRQKQEIDIGVKKMSENLVTLRPHILMHYFTSSDDHIHQKKLTSYHGEEDRSERRREKEREEQTLRVMCQSAESNRKV